MRRLLAPIIVWIGLVPAVALAAQQTNVLICDLVSSQSSIGSLLDSLYSEHGYDVQSIEHIPPSDSFPEVTIIWAGIPEYGFSHDLTHAEEDVIIGALVSGRSVWGMGQRPFSRIHAWFGFDEPTWDPQPLDTLYGVDWNFLAGYTWLYQERPMSTYAVTGFDGMTHIDDWEVIYGGPDNPGSRGCRAVAYADSQYYYKTLVLNIDLSLIIERDTFATVEDFALKVMQDWFELWPVGVEEKGSEVLPSSLYLTNYPNPFNNATHITYRLTRPGHVKLEVFNLFGQRLVTLVDSRQHSGNTSIVWDASGVASGIYFYRLSAGNYTFTRKMVLSK